MGPLAFHISHFIETHSIFLNLFEQGIDGQVRWYGNNWPHESSTRLRSGAPYMEAASLSGV